MWIGCRWKRGENALAREGSAKSGLPAMIRRTIPRDPVEPRRELRLLPPRRKLLMHGQKDILRYLFRFRRVPWSQGGSHQPEDAVLVPLHEHAEQVGVRRFAVRRDQFLIVHPRR